MGVAYQLSLSSARSAPLQAAVDALADSEDVNERGAVFTRLELVTGILDLSGYQAERPLTDLRLLEPAAGEGEFLLAAVARLLDACSKHHGPPQTQLARLRPAVRAVEVHRPTFLKLQQALRALLRRRGLSSRQARQLADSWLIQDDFLLTELEGRFDVIIGNPPYVRRERIPPVLLEAYKQRYQTLYDRADLYVLFYERCLDLLKKQGVLGFICSNRWLKNKFGGPLREKVATGFNLDIYIDLSQVDAFARQVDAYASITVIRRTPPGDSQLLLAPKSSSPEALLSALHRTPTRRVRVLPHAGARRDPWLVDAPEVIDTLRRLEASFPTLESTGAQVGIGVATGADEVFIGAFDDLPVEPARKLPLALAQDVQGPELRWSGMGLVNPWAADGSLAPLDTAPKFGAFMRRHETRLRRRYTARQRPDAWYKTIDRVYAGLRDTPKLLIPDIKGDLLVAHDPGALYPHHNLYVITADARWDLQVLQALLRSSVALMFVGAYSVRMSGGFLRFQAQYLRRIRLPQAADLSQKLCARLRSLSQDPDRDAVDAAAAEAYGLTPAELQKLAAYAQGLRVGRIRYRGFLLM